MVQRPSRVSRGAFSARRHPPALLQAGQSPRRIRPLSPCVCPSGGAGLRAWKFATSSLLCQYWCWGDLVRTTAPNGAPRGFCPFLLASISAVAHHRWPAPICLCPAQAPDRMQNAFQRRRVQEGQAQVAWHLTAPPERTKGEKRVCHLIWSQGPRRQGHSVASRET